MSEDYNEKKVREIISYTDRITESLGIENGLLDKRSSGVVEDIITHLN